MGFLKELFEKKKKAGLKRGDSGVDCDRVQSEFFPPNLRLGSVNSRQAFRHDRRRDLAARHQGTQMRRR